ncbi:MAG: phosphoglycerate mutase, partial [Candidatus Diapherotrites archaeon]|nr:phosphoglycerate mutase [Candidatus Diapherotrites archaeon]
MEMEILPSGKKVVLVVLDGLGDRRASGRLTPLEAAKTPTLDELAREGSCGLHYPLSPGVPIGSGLAHTLIFGYDEEDYPGRGVLEAFGAGIELGPNDVAFRINFATVDENYVVLDRRAGRRGEFIPQMAKELEEVLNANPFGVRVRLLAYEGYRGVLVISGELLKPVPDLDPQVEGQPIRFSEDESTGRILNWIVIHAHEFLKDHPLNKKREEMGLPPA